MGQQKDGSYPEMPPNPDPAVGWLPSRLVLGDGARVIAFVRKHLLDQLGSVSDFEKSQAIGVLMGGELVAGVVYHDYRAPVGDIQLSVAATSARWASRSVIRELLAYPFEQLQCRRLTATVRSDNLRALKFDIGIGFRVEGRMRDYYGRGIHQIILGMLRDEWQFGNYGRISDG